MRDGVEIRVTRRKMGRTEGARAGSDLDVVKRLAKGIERVEYTRVTAHDTDVEKRWRRRVEG